MLQKLLGLCDCFAWNKKQLVKINNHTFKVKHQLGEGGFSFVFLVEDLRTGQLFALKRTYCQTPEQLKKAIFEAEVVKCLNQRNLSHIVRLHDNSVINQDDDVSEVAMVMDYFPKGSLFDKIEAMQKDGRMFSEKEILSMFLGVCEAVLGLHTNEPAWVHNDLKPGNLLVSDSNQLVLTDFGSVSPARVIVKSRVQALQLQDYLESHSTPAYRAPEFFDIPSDCVLDERTDVWSLGCILYALAFGKSPFEASVMERGGSLGLAIRSGRYKVPDSHPFSDGLLALIASMLQTDLAYRPFVPDIIRKIQQMI
eukprot:c2094_g1_i1.p1 GENE.c2094_g1_i1~~c2094_g1_i1.p1  ORF type:complete len:310 (+),score=81.20 c2094_g1_i1:33-962(+)